MQARHTAPWLILVLGLALILKAGPVLGQEMFIYPARGQSPEQQSRDRYECHNWAVQQTGFDPTAPQMVQTPPPAPEAPQGGLFRGALGGSALGAIGGAIGGSGGGCGPGAATGALFGGHTPGCPIDRSSKPSQSGRRSAAPWRR
jgi:hypothetical protein